MKLKTLALALIGSALVTGTAMADRGSRYSGGPVGGRGDYRGGSSIRGGGGDYRVNSYRSYDRGGYGGGRYDSHRPSYGRSSVSFGFGYTRYGTSTGSSFDFGINRYGGYAPRPYAPRVYSPTPYYSYSRVYYPVAPRVYVPAYTPAYEPVYSAPVYAPAYPSTGYYRPYYARPVYVSPGYYGSDSCYPY